MATELLTTGSTAANSSDVVVADGASLTVAIKGELDSTAFVRILLKDDAGSYADVGELTPFRRAVVIAAPGTYRFTRRAGGTCGVFSG